MASSIGTSLQGGIINAGGTSLGPGGSGGGESLGISPPGVLPVKILLTNGAFDVSAASTKIAWYMIALLPAHTNFDGANVGQGVFTFIYKSLAAPMNVAVTVSRVCTLSLDMLFYPRAFLDNHADES